MIVLTIATPSHFAMIDVTDRVAELVRQSGIQEGSCHCFVPHTTAAITINEKADPDVPKDILAALDRLVPLTAGYRHREGNAAAHVKASLFGASAQIIIDDGRLVLGTWQSLFFCEFDGPRTRRLLIRLAAK